MESQAYGIRAHPNRSDSRSFRHKHDFRSASRYDGRVGAMDWVDRLRQAVDATGKHSVVAADAGIHPSSLSEILNRVTRPQFETVIDICRACGVTVGWILGEQGFELGDADYEQIAAIQGWTTQKLEERNARGLTKFREPARTVSVFPAVATQRGETWTDPDEINDRDIPR